MPQNLFKIYGNRNYFWQWDTNQKIIVLDDTVDQVHFSNKDMAHAISQDVYDYHDNLRVCDVPDVLLMLPKNLIAYTYVTDSLSNKTTHSVKFMVRQRPIPSNYVSNQETQFKELANKIIFIEQLLEDGGAVKRFNTAAEAEQWAQESKEVGAVISVNVDSKWVVYTVEEDYSIYPVCDCDEDALIKDIEELQRLVGESPVADQIKNAIDALNLSNTYESKGSAAQALVDAKKYTDDRAKDYDVAGSAKAVQTALDQEVARAKNEEAAITRATQQINDRVTDAKEDIVSNKKAIDLLNGKADVEGSVDYKIAQAVALIMDNPDEAVNSINELINWVRENEASGSAAAPKMTTITLLADAWIGDASPYSQVVSVNGVTENSKVDLQPDAQLITKLTDAEISLTTENDAGVITVWAIGEKPSEDMTVQALITEVTLL